MPRHDDYIARPRETRRRKLTRAQRAAQHRAPRGSLPPIQRQIARGLNGDPTGGPIARELAQPENRVGDAHDRFARKTLLRFAEDFPSQARQPIVVAALARLCIMRRHWINTPHTWQPPRDEARELAWSLACHLLARYPMPRWLIGAWVGNDRFASRARMWFVHLGAGQNLRDAPGLPYALTRQMAHWATNAPDDLSCGGAIRYGQLRGLGVNHELPAVNAACGRLSHPQHDEGFWYEFGQWYAQNYRLCWTHIDLIIEFVHMQRFGQFGPAPWPDLGIGAFQPLPLARLAIAWRNRQDELRREQRAGWKRCGVASFEKRLANGDLARIIELTTPQQLRAEGEALDHCVFTYCDRAADGACAIFSLRYKVAGKFVPELTIEVLLPDRLIVQVRGMSNRPPRSDEMQIIHDWARFAGLHVDPACTD